MSSSRSFYIFIIVVVLFVVATALEMPLVVNAAKYAQVSLEIIRNHDWINLTIAGDAYDQKPPLLFWIGALGYSVFGFSVTVYKLSVLLFSLLGLYSAFRLAKQLYNEETARLTVVFWATSLAFLHFNNDIHTDTLLASFVVFSVWQWIAFLEFRKWHQFLLGSIGVGLSMLTKGPVGAIIPVVVVASSLLVKKQWREIFHPRWLLSLLVIGIVILPALIGLLNQFGLEGIKFYFWTNNVGRVTGSYHSGSVDYFFYLHTALYLLLPWSVFFLVAFFFEFRQFFKADYWRGDKKDLPLLAGLLVFIVILSVAQQQNPHYLLSALPFIYIVVAKWVTHMYAIHEKKTLKKVIVTIHKVIAVLLPAFMLVITLYVYPEHRPVYWIVYGLFMLIILYFVFRPLALQKQMAMLVLSAAALLFTINVSMYPHMLRYHTSLDAARVFNDEAPAGTTLNIYSNEARFWNLFLYSKSPGKYLETDEELQAFLPHPGEWIYTSENGYKKLLEMNPRVEIKKVYEQHRSLTRQSIRFLNPKTRSSRFRKMYLLELH